MEEPTTSESSAEKIDDVEKTTDKCAPSTTSSEEITKMEAPSGNGDSTRKLEIQKRFNLIKSVGEECIQLDELELLLERKFDRMHELVCYDGFEPSGRIHVAQGVMKALNVNKLTQAGCTVKIWIADWFAQLNNKMDGNLVKIRNVGQYMIEVWKAVGMRHDQVQFLWSSEEINTKADVYWPLVIDIARRYNLNRIIRCCQIMGRNESDQLSAAQILYPCMQCADIFFLKADICQLGMDQRKVNMLAREYSEKAKRKPQPIILSHHMLSGLTGQGKMSKSDPNSAIYMEDEEVGQCTLSLSLSLTWALFVKAEVNVKIKNAFCPPQVTKDNPCMEYVQYIILPWFGSFEVLRKEKDGGDKVYHNVDEVTSDYESGALHPSDLKSNLSKAVNKILQPVRDHFKNNADASKLLKKVKVMLLRSSDFTIS